LFTLIENAGTVISRLSLTELIRWGDAWWDNKVENKLDVYIASLRRKLWADCIETIKGMGYKMMKSE
jgi:two-component system OmpR family response regulator/two-component system response regulator QseB